MTISHRTDRPQRRLFGFLSLTDIRSTADLQRCSVLWVYCGWRSGVRKRNGTTRDKGRGIHRTPATARRIAFGRAKTLAHCTLVIGGSVRSRAEPHPRRDYITVGMLGP